MSKVVVEKISRSISGAVSSLLDQVELPDLNGRHILIKPNMGRMADNNSGIVTSKEVLFPVIEYFLKLEAGSVYVGDSPITGVDSMEAFAQAGITQDNLPDGAELVNLDGEKPVEVEVPQGRLIHKMKVCAHVCRADFVVSLPVMKTHMHTVVSLGLKNMKGCLYKKEKVAFHKLDAGSEKEKSLDIAISDLASVLLPDLTVVDGSIGMEGFGPSSGDAVKPGILAAGTDCIAVDAVCAELMGFSAASIPSLRLCNERGLGESDVSKINVVPSTYAEWKTEFKPAPLAIDIEYEGVFVYEGGACSACLSTLVLFLKRYAEEIKSLFGNEDVHIYIGDKNEVGNEENTILIGRCTSQHKGKGIFVQGCPPVASVILEQIREAKS